MRPILESGIFTIIVVILYIGAIALALSIPVMLFMGVKSLKSIQKQLDELTKK